MCKDLLVIVHLRRWVLRDGAGGSCREGFDAALAEFLDLRRGKDGVDRVMLSTVLLPSQRGQIQRKNKCRWYVLGYSVSRFRDFLHLPCRESQSSWPWKVLSTKGIETGGGAERAGDGRILYTPVVYHWAYEVGLND